MRHSRRKLGVTMRVVNYVECTQWASITKMIQISTVKFFSERRCIISMLVQFRIYSREGLVTNWTFYTFRQCCDPNGQIQPPAQGNRFKKRAPSSWGPLICFQTHSGNFQTEPGIFQNESGFFQTESGFFRDGFWRVFGFFAQFYGSKPSFLGSAPIVSLLPRLGMEKRGQFWHITDKRRCITI